MNQPMFTALYALCQVDDKFHWQAMHSNEVTPPFDTPDEANQWIASEDSYTFRTGQVRDIEL